MRNYWKQKLNRRKRLVRISNDIHETGQPAIEGHLPIRGLETNLVNKRQRDLDILEKEKPITEIASNAEHKESIKDESTFATNSNLPDKQEHNVKSFDETQEIPEFRNKEKALLLKDSDNAPDDGKDVTLQVSCLVSDIHPSASDTLCRQPYLEPDDSLSADPIIAPVWRFTRINALATYKACCFIKQLSVAATISHLSLPCLMSRGWFNIKEESEICVEILAHLSNKACLKVSDAAAAMPPMLDVILLDKHVTWPNSFRDAPPTAASIGLYFFPACERDERVYESLLDEVIEKDLALKVMIDNVELLIFSSSELPLQHWRFNSKYFLWGVFKKMHNSYSSTESATSMQRNNGTQLFRLPEPTAIGNEEDLVRSQHVDHPSPPSRPYQSPVNLRSSQASNVPPSMPESPSLELSKLDKTVGIR